jgi:hypothetical protein
VANMQSGLFAQAWLIMAVASYYEVVITELEFKVYLRGSMTRKHGFVIVNLPWIYTQF